MARKANRIIAVLGAPMLTLALALPVAGATAAAPAAAVAVTCAVRTVAGSSPCDDVHAITGAEQHVIADLESRIGNGEPDIRPYNDKEDDQPPGEVTDPGNCTIGIGHLIHKGPCTADDYADWSHVTADTLVKIFAGDIASHEAGLNKDVVDKLGLKLNPCQYDALLDLYFNGGPSWFKPGSRLYQALQAGDLQAVPGILASDVPENLPAGVEKNLTDRRVNDAARFRLHDCPCKYVEIFGTVTYSDNQTVKPNNGVSGSSTDSGSFKLDLISTRLPPSTYWESAGSTFNIHYKFLEVQKTKGCTTTTKGSAQASGPVPYGPPGKANGYSGILASWRERSPAATVSFIVQTVQKANFTATSKGSLPGCKGTTNWTADLLFRPYCFLNPPPDGYFEGRYDSSNDTITAKCSGTAPQNLKYRVSGLFHVYKA
jgi:GH24 family phage-related lysozyme (muramidase)